MRLALSQVRTAIVTLAGKMVMELARKVSGLSVLILASTLLCYLAERPANEHVAIYFHIVYLALLGALSIHLTLSVVQRRYRMAYFAVIWTMVCLRLLSTTVVPYPIIEDTDPKFELQIVRAIMSGGGIPWGQGSGEAISYSYFPGLEIAVSVLSSVSSIPEVALFKYAGSFLGVITVLLLLQLYRHLSRVSSVLSMSFAAMSPWFIPFDTYTIHPTLGLVFLAMLLLSLDEPGKAWNVVKVLAITAMVITHAAGSYPALFLLLILAALKWHRKASVELPNLRISTAILLASVVSIWGGLVSLSYLETSGLPYFLLNMIRVLLGAEFTARPVSPTGFKPFWIVALTATGLFTYGLITLGMLVKRLLRKRNGQCEAENWLAMTGLLMFGLFLLPYLAGLLISTDLLPRGLTYLYLLASPLVAGFLVLLLRPPRPAANLASRSVRRIALTAFLISLLLVPAVYYGVPAGIHEPSSPKRRIDYRLSLNQWQVAAVFAAQKISDHTVYGVRLAFDFVGGLAGKDVLEIDVPPHGSLLSWFEQHEGQLVFLRRSIATTPETNLLVSETDLLSTVNRSDILYSSGEVIILMRSA